MNTHHQLIHCLALSIEYKGRFIHGELPEIPEYYENPNPEQKKEMERLGEILDNLNKQGIRFIPYSFKEFPECLQSSNETGAPVGLFVKGDTDLRNLFQTTAGIVGTRDMSYYGRSATYAIVEEIKATNPRSTIISGLAFGVDAIAHREALNTGLKTVAVLPTCVDNIYPCQHKQLAEEIVDKGGALISHFPPGTAPAAINFLSRNQIIAALSDTLYVPESKAKGGAIVTAKYAYVLGKEIQAVPGRYDDVRSQGCNDLIKQGIADLWTKTKN